jgi:cell pole-organizing protein PopZ
MADAAKGAGEDPSMEDILASIRKILHEPQAKPSAPGTAAAEPDFDDDVLDLNPSMIVNSHTLAHAAAQPLHTIHPADILPPEVQSAEVPAEMPSSLPPPSPALPAGEIDGGKSPDFRAQAEMIVAPETEAAAAAPLGDLMRKLSEDRHAIVQRGGPAIEDIVRELLRPLLKDWLDAHLPGLVERLVRAEIERVIRRAGP